MTLLDRTKLLGRGKPGALRFDVPSGPARDVVKLVERQQK